MECHSEGKRVEFFGGYQVYSESGIDLTLLRERLRLTETERWQENGRALRLVEELRRAGDAGRDNNSTSPGREPR